MLRYRLRAAHTLLLIHWALQYRGNCCNLHSHYRIMFLLLICMPRTLTRAVLLHHDNLTALPSPVSDDNVLFSVNTMIPICGRSHKHALATLCVWQQG